MSEHDSTATLIRMAYLMVVDDVTMMDCRALESADRTFQWLRESAKPFGGTSDGLGTKNSPGIFTHQRPTEGGVARACTIFDAHKEQALLIAPVIVNINSEAINSYTQIHKTH